MRSNEWQRCTNTRRKLCARWPRMSASAMRSHRGRYRTVINIHNPTERKIEIARKFALAIQPGEAPGSFSITPYKSLTLEPDQAVAYNCFDISNFYCPIHGVCVDFTAIDGFLVVNSPV